MANRERPGEVERKERRAEAERQEVNWRRLAMLASIVLLLIFVIQNFQEVNVDFLFFTSVSTPLIVALTISAFFGALIGWLAPRVRRR